MKVKELMTLLENIITEEISSNLMGSFIKNYIAQNKDNFSFPALENSFKEEFGKPMSSIERDMALYAMGKYQLKSQEKNYDWDAIDNDSTFLESQEK